MTEKALFAAGCFWGVQYYFDEVPGVAKTIVGYTGGHTDTPTYWEVASRATGHAESVLVEFDSKKVTYKTLLKHFFRLHDPTQLNRQGPDIGDEYRSAIFYFNDKQRAAAEEARDETQKQCDESVVTEITPAGTFYRAEAEHQHFTKRTGVGVCHVPYEPL